MKKLSSLPYLYCKLFKTFSYSVEKWVEMGACPQPYRKRTTQSDFIVTREYEIEKKQVMTWAATEKVMVKLELCYSAENKRVITIKYGEKETLSPQQLQVSFSNQVGVKRIKEEIHIMLQELLRRDFIR